jgi:hypothetical protein
MWAMLMKFLRLLFSGEDLGKSEVENADAQAELRNIQKASDARTAVDDSAAAIVRDNDNSGPATGPNH